MFAEGNKRLSVGNWASMRLLEPVLPPFHHKRIQAGTCACLTHTQPGTGNDIQLGS
jgi:hypothetical protein